MTYGILLVTSFWLSYQLTHDFVALPVSRLEFMRELFPVVALQLGCLTWRKQCTGLLSYFSLHELRQVGTALAAAALALLALRFAVEGGPPRNIILIDAFLSFQLLSGFRLLLRRWRESSGDDKDAPTDPPARVGIIGAGTAGAKLAVHLIGKKNSGRVVVAFFDDDVTKWRKQIHQVPVVGMPECLLEGWTDKLDEVVIAMPSASVERIREIDRLLRKTGLKFYSVSSSHRLWSSATEGESVRVE
jgi:FlaA1/EpsC-like NDP-sugar epimerase